MALPVADSAFYPTPEETLAIALTNVRYAYALSNVEVNVTDGSELYERFKVLSDLVSIAINNNELALADVSPLDATGDSLEELAGTYGVKKRPASSAAGTVIAGVVGSGTVTIPANFIATSAFGIQVQTTSAFTVSDGDGVTVQALSAGSNTDLEEDDIVTWDSAAIGSLEQTATVAAGGVTGGDDEDTEEELRGRLLSRLRDPGFGGNAAFVANTAENTSAGIQRCFVYMAPRGPSSYDAAIVRDAADRALSAAVINTAATGILATMPGSADLNATSVLPVEVDVVINTSLPLPVNAGGAGGGFRDAVPWPSTSEAVIDTFAEIVAIGALGGNDITVNSGAADPPKVGDRFGVWIADNEEMLELTVRTVAGGAGAWDIEVDGSVSSLDIGMLCSAGAVNLAQYAAEFLAALKLMGPGEKTSNIDKIPRALRHPGADVEFPQNMTALQLTAVINEHQEILNMTYATTSAGLAIYLAGTGASGLGTFVDRSSTPVATIETDPPNQLVLRHLSFRRQA